eukprot:9487321-Pyramimonas_sp.AAC.1
MRGLRRNIHKPSGEWGGWQGSQEMGITGGWRVYTIDPSCWLCLLTSWSVGRSVMSPACFGPWGRSLHARSSSSSSLTYSCPLRKKATSSPQAFADHRPSAQRITSMPLPALQAPPAPVPHHPHTEL